MVTFRKWRGNLLLVLVSIAAVLGLFEMFLRFEDRHKLAPYYKWTFGGSDYQLFTDPAEFAVADNRVLIFGDSFVAGVACSADATNFPGWVQRRLDNRQVFNFGMGGKTVVDYVHALDYMELKADDRIFVVLYLNDVFLDRRVCERIVARPEWFSEPVTSECGTIVNNEKVDNFGNNHIRYFVRVAEAVASASYSARLAKDALYNIPVFQGLHVKKAEYQRLWNEFDQPGYRSVIESIQQIEHIARRAGIKPQFLYYPNTDRISADDPRHESWRTFIAQAERDIGTKIADPYPYFVAQAPKRKMSWSLTDKHPSCAAHEIMADYFVRAYGLD